MRFKRLRKNFRGLSARFRRLPADLRDPKRRADAIRLIICTVCIAVIAASGAYSAHWLFNLERIERESERYSQMYVPSEETYAPASVTPEPAQTPAASPDPLPEVVDIPLATPDADTIILALPDAPQPQASFAELLSFNEDTIGFLEIGDLVSLPVVQKLNDNEYYLTHTFAREEGSEGALFLDGLNRLTPEDDCLIVYGHNMHNGTMFGSLKQLLQLSALQNCAAVSFDTIYQNYAYVPFAVFSASMDANDANYFDVRQFVFDEASFELFVLRLKNRSKFDIPVDVTYGDHLLLLVTCDSSGNDGRLIVALRRLRDGETETDAVGWLAQAR